MNSSISASEPALWRRYVQRYLLALGLAAAVLLASLLALDPYDSGCFALVPAVGVPTLGPRLADASRGRDPAFDSAVLGNSTIQLLRPARLDALLGRRFVNLSVPGTGPYEQVVLLDWFSRHHPRGGGMLIIGLDLAWCRPGERFFATMAPNPFPFWLYGSSRLDYIAHMFNFKVIEAAGRKIRLLAGGARPARRDGFDDYEAGKTYDLAAARARFGAPETGAAGETERAAVDSGDTAGDFTALEALDAHVGALPPRTTVVLVFPPRRAASLPPPGSPAAATVAACKQAAAALVRHRPGALLLDFLRSGPLTLADDNYWDDIHYRGAVAELMERSISAAITGTSEMGSDIVAVTRGASPD